MPGRPLHLLWLCALSVEVPKRHPFIALYMNEYKNDTFHHDDSNTKTQLAGKRLDRQTDKAPTFSSTFIDFSHLLSSHSLGHNSLKWFKFCRQHLSAIYSAQQVLACMHCEKQEWDESKWQAICICLCICQWWPSSTGQERPARRSTSSTSRDPNKMEIYWSNLFGNLFAKRVTVISCGIWSGSRHLLI